MEFRRRNMLAVSRIFVLLVVLIIVVIFIYRRIYTHNINKRIQLGEIQGGKMVDMSKMINIAVIVGLIVYSVIVTYLVNDYANQEYTVSRNDYAVIDVSNPEEYKYAGYFGNAELEDASFAKGYNKEENPGYEKEIVESGDYVFTVFTRTAPADNFHSDFLCFVEYVGTEKEKYTCYDNAGYQVLKEDGGYSFAGSAGDITDCLLYIGNLDEDCSFQITMSLLDEEAEQKYMQAEEQAYLDDKGEFPNVEDYAVSVATVSIQIK